MNKTSLHPIDLVEAPIPQPIGPALVAKDMSLVGHVPVALTALIGNVSLTVDQLFALKKGEVLAMNESIDAPITLELNGKPVARGELVAVDDHFGVRITELS